MKSSFSSIKIATPVITGLGCTAEQRARGKHHAQRRRLRIRSNLSRSSALLSIVAVCIILLMSIPFLYYDVAGRSFPCFDEAKKKTDHLHSYITANFPPSASKKELLDKHGEASTPPSTPFLRKRADTDKKNIGSALDAAAPFIHIGESLLVVSNSV